MSRIKNAGTVIISLNILIIGLFGAYISFSDNPVLMDSTLEVGDIWGVGYRFSLEQESVINIHIEVVNDPPLEFEVYWTEGTAKEVYIEEGNITIYDKQFLCPKRGDYVFGFKGSIYLTKTEAIVKIYEQG